MGVLDELKQKSAEQQARETARREEQTRRETFYRDELKPRLEQLFGFLHEFGEQLNYVRPDVRASYRLPEDFRLDALSQGDYNLNCDSRDNMTEIAFRLFCKDEGKLLIELTEKDRFNSMKEFLHRNRLTYRTHEFKDERHNVIGGQITLERKVPVIFKFDADIENSCIVLWIRNFASLGLQKFILFPNQINDEFLDGLGRFIMRETDSFVRLELPEEQRLRIQANIERERQAKEEEIRKAEAARLRQEQEEEQNKLVSRLKEQVRGICQRVRKTPS
jgi:hypothetical protein